MTTNDATTGRYADEMRRRARRCGLVLGTIGLMLVPAWGGFDRLLVPEHARTFLELRLLCDVPMAVLTLVLAVRPIGRRRPELLTLLILAVVQGEIAWMVVRAGSARDFYLLGFSLPLYASGCMMGGRPRWTAGVAAATWLSFCVALLGAPTPLSGRDLIASVFYLGTASIIGYVGHAQRYRIATRELSIRGDLEVEQARTNELLVQLERLSHEDALTGLANRRRWDTEIATVCARSRQVGCGVAVLIVDIDRFKDVNDRYGHGGGDEALRAVGDLLARHVRDGDLVARIGGDEFGVLLVGADAVRAAELAEELRAAAAGLRTASHVAVSLSLGVAAAAGDNLYAELLMAQADEQLYRAKATRNAVGAAHLSLVADVS